MIEPQTDWYMTVAEVAAEQRLAVETLYSWRSKSVATGQNFGPRSSKRGRRIVYKRSDVDAWVAAQEAATSAGGVS